jgi:acetyl-CoA carboxylase carboxyl transferase subunit beta
VDFFEKVKSPKLKSTKKVNNDNPAGLWKKCAECGEIVQNKKLINNDQVCPYCDHHFRLNAQKRLDLIIDENSFISIESTLDSSDPLEFNDKKSYKERLKQAQKKTDLIDGTIAGQATINSIPVSIAIMNFEFMGGSMGVVTGEKISRVLEVALEKRIPAIVVSSSGGARMQEGILSLMQMAKTSAVISKLKEENIPYISVLTDPTTGGCAASFAMLGDINIAEPKALIGFAGPRVIEQSIKQILPEGFQTSEFLLEHGFIDRIIHRLKMKEELTSIIKMFTNND